MGNHRGGAATTRTALRRPNPAGAWGLRADTASLVVDDGSPSTPPRSLSAPRKPHARDPTQYPDRLLVTGDTEPAARQVVTQAETEQDQEPEQTRGQNERREARAVAHVHEEQDDERRL